MKAFEYWLIQHLTNRYRRRLSEEGKQETDNGLVEQVPGFKVFFMFFALLGIVLGLGVAFWAGQPLAGVILFLIFGGISIPVLISYHTCWIRFDEEGFTRSNFLGRTHRYSYSEVLGLYRDSSCVLIEVKGPVRITLNETWINRDRLAFCIQSHTKNLKKLPQPLVGLSYEQIETSYQKGVLNKALLVPKKELAHFKVHRTLHRILFCISVVSLVFLFFASGSTLPLVRAVFFLDTVLLNVLMLVALALYYAYPSFYTMREKASGIELDKEMSKRHKCCTLPIVALCSFFANALLFIASISPMRTINGVQVFLALVIVLIVVCLAMFRFRRKSMEYRQYRVGWISFVFWQCWYGLGLLLLLIAVGL